MNRLILVFMLLTIVVFSTTAQNSYFSKRVNIKLGLSPMVREIIESEKIYDYTLNANVNYNIFKVLDAGLRLGYTQTTREVRSEIGEKIIREGIPLIFYGINLNLQLMPLILKDYEFPLNVYARVYIGGSHMVVIDDERFMRNDLEQSVGVGLCWYFYKNWGVFSEFSYADYLNSEVQNQNIMYVIDDSSPEFQKYYFSYGISVRF